MRRILLTIVAMMPLMASAQETSDWELFIEAIAKVESNHKEKADDGHGCWGILQITDIYVREVNRIYGTHFVHEDCFNREKSMTIFKLMQDAKNPSHDFRKALDIHNPRHPQVYADKIYQEFNRLKNKR